MKIKAEVWEENGTWCASVPALPGCETCADNYEELKEHLKDAIEGWLDAMNSMETTKKTDMSFIILTVIVAVCLCVTNTQIMPFRVQD